MKSKCILIQTIENYYVCIYSQSLINELIYYK